jgi:hypothetical protein
MEETRKSGGGGGDDNAIVKIKGDRGATKPVVKVCVGNVIRRLQLHDVGYDALLREVREAYPSDAIVRVTYRDDEGDVITVSTEGELQEAFNVYYNGYSQVPHTQKPPLKLDIVVTGGQRKEGSVAPQFSVLPSNSHYLVTPSIPTCVVAPSLPTVSCVSPPPLTLTPHVSNLVPQETETGADESETMLSAPVVAQTLDAPCRVTKSIGEVGRNSAAPGGLTFCGVTRLHTDESVRNASNHDAPLSDFSASSDINCGVKLAHPIEIAVSPAHGVSPLATLLPSSAKSAVHVVADSVCVTTDGCSQSRSFVPTGKFITGQGKPPTIDVSAGLATPSPQTFVPASTSYASSPSPAPPPVAVQADLYLAPYLVKAKSQPLNLLPQSPPNPPPSLPSSSTTPFSLYPNVSLLSLSPLLSFPSATSTAASSTEPVHSQVQPGARKDPEHLLCGHSIKQSARVSDSLMPAVASSTHGTRSLSTSSWAHLPERSSHPPGHSSRQASDFSASSSFGATSFAASTRSLSPSLQAPPRSASQKEASASQKEVSASSRRPDIFVVARMERELDTLLHSFQKETGLWFGLVRREFDKVVDAEWVRVAKIHHAVAQPDVTTTQKRRTRLLKRYVNEDGSGDDSEDNNCTTYTGASGDKALTSLDGGSGGGGGGGGGGADRPKTAHNRREKLLFQRKEDRDDDEEEEVKANAEEDVKTKASVIERDLFANVHRNVTSASILALSNLFPASSRTVSSNPLKKKTPLSKIPTKAALSEPMSAPAETTPEVDNETQTRSKTTTMSGSSASVFETGMSTRAQDTRTSQKKKEVAKSLGLRTFDMTGSGVKSFTNNGNSNVTGNSNITGNSGSARSSNGINASGIKTSGGGGGGTALSLTTSAASDADFERSLPTPKLRSNYKQLVAMGYSESSCRDVIIKYRSYANCLDRCINDLTT